MLTRLVLSAALFIAIAECAPSSRNDRKCLPMQWEAVVLGKVGLIYQGQGTLVSVVSTFSADYSKNMDAFVESIYSDDKFVGNYTYLRTEKSAYLIDTIKMKCTMMPVSKVFQLCSDTDGLTYKASMSIGDQMVDVYDLVDENRPKRTITVLRKNFSFVSEIFTQTFTGTPQMLAFQFGNSTMGIKDPSVFKVPSYC